MSAHWQHLIITARGEIGLPGKFGGRVFLERGSKIFMEIINHVRGFFPVSESAVGTTTDIPLKDNRSKVPAPDC